MHSDMAENNVKEKRDRVSIEAGAQFSEHLDNHNVLLTYR